MVLGALESDWFYFKNFLLLDDVRGLDFQRDILLHFDVFLSQTLLYHLELFLVEAELYVKCLEEVFDALVDVELHMNWSLFGQAEHFGAHVNFNSAN